MIKILTFYLYFSVKKKDGLIRIKSHSIRIKIHSIRGHPISLIPPFFWRVLIESWDLSLVQFPWCRKATCNRLSLEQAPEGRRKGETLAFLRLHWGLLLTVKNNTGTVRMTATMTASRTVRMRMSFLLWYLWRRFDSTRSKTKEKVKKKQSTSLNISFYQQQRICKPKAKESNDLGVELSIKTIHRAEKKNPLCETYSHCSL